MQMVSSDKYYDEVYGEGAFNRSITSLGEGRLPAWVGVTLLSIEHSHLCI